MSFDLTNKNISDTFQNVLQVTGSNGLYFLSGSLVTALIVSGTLYSDNISAITAKTGSWDAGSTGSLSVSEINAKTGSWDGVLAATGSYVLESETGSFASSSDVVSNTANISNLTTKSGSWDDILTATSSYLENSDTGSMGNLTVVGYISASGNISGSTIHSAGAVQSAGIELMKVNVTNIDADGRIAISGSWQGVALLSSSAQITADISGSWTSARLPANTLSSSYQIEADISGSWQGVALLSSSAQIAADISGSWQYGVGILSASSQILHENLANLQGGTTKEYYHYTIAQHAYLLALISDSLVSSSVQLAADITGSWKYGTGIFSGSDQLPSGIISGSAQLPAGLISGSDFSGSFDGLVSASNGFVVEVRTADPASTEVGQMWFRSDL